MTERTTSAGFNRILRASNHLPYKFTAMANYPIAPRIMLSVLDDFRLVNDEFIEILQRIRYKAHEASIE